jgi:amidase
MEDNVLMRPSELVQNSAQLCRLSASELAAAIRARELSSVDVVEAHLERIEQRNPDINAIVSLAPEQALEEAARADEDRRNGRLRGPLHGLPIAIKDLEETAGLRTTWGSPIYADHVPEHDSALVARLRRAGAVIVGKTNVPEFGAGSQTFNPVFGPTRNPYDRGRTAGGSSGGAAAAVAAEMLPFADGSDLGGSLRNPASFCNVVGLRASPGRVPCATDMDGWDPFTVRGPIARTVEDLALLFAAMCAHDPWSPLSVDDVRPVSQWPARELRGLRVAWSRDLGGLPVEPEAMAVLEAQVARLEELGCVVEEAEPDLRGADEAFETLRALRFAGLYGPLLDEHRGLLKDTVVWNIERGLELTPVQISRAFDLRTSVFRAMVAFLERYDVLAAPVTQVLPFPVEQEWVTEIAGVPMEHYLAWMRSCSRITVTSHPALSLPAGFTRHGLPVGMQLVGRYRDEPGLLGIARAIEHAAAVGQGRRRGLQRGDGRG